MGRRGTDNSGAIAPSPGSRLDPNVVASNSVDSPSESEKEAVVSVLITDLSEMCRYESVCIKS